MIPRAIPHSNLRVENMIFKELLNSKLYFSHRSLSAAPDMLLIVHIHSSDTARVAAFSPKCMNGNVLRCQMFSYSPRENSKGYILDKFHGQTLNIFGDMN